MTVKIYEYQRCSTCQKALRFLEERKVLYTRLPIVEKPPTRSELKKMLSWVKVNGGNLKKLFNTSGEVYREMGLSQKLGKMSEDDALSLLEKNGKLVKRPFVLMEKQGLVGFKEEEWEKVFG